MPAPAATADIIGPQDPDDPQVDSPWQAGTCTSDAGPCSVATPAQFYERAAGHPPVGFTQFIVNSEDTVGGPVPIGNLRTVRVDLPPGLTVNPQSSEQCELEPGESPAECASTAPGSKVGYSEVTATNPATGFSLDLPAADVYNVVPEAGEPARFGLSLLGNDVFLEADVAWESDYHEYFTIHVAKLDLPTLPLLGEFARVAKNRLVFDGTAGSAGSFITTPTTCLGPATPGSPFEHVYSTYLRADAYEAPNMAPDFPRGSAFVESKIPRKPGEFETSPKECETIPFDPSIAVDPHTDRTDSPSGASVDVQLPEVKGAGSQGSSHTRSASVTLPPGMGLNPSAANGLQACTDEQFGKGTRDPVTCPEASRIGTVEVDTPPLPDGSLSGPVYVGRQLSRDPASGDLYRIFVVVESSRYDISARLLGRAHVDPQSGQITTVFDDGALGKAALDGLPQVPFESFRINLDGGPTAVLTSPPSCGPNAASTTMAPWSGNPAAVRSTEFSLGAAPGGGGCAKTLAERPFSPDLAAGSASHRAGAFSPLRMSIARADGEQELKGVDVTLPPGLSAKLAGVDYCPESALAAAAARSGADEAAGSSCPASSRIGRADVAAGSGPAPIRIDGQVFLAGPYEGAPLSLAVVTPATAGPFDLGTVVVRVALFVDRRTAQVRARSDAIPHVYGGATLDIRKVDVELDRRDFSLNPTSCSPPGFGGALLGGGADPTSSAAFSATPVSVGFPVSGCEKLEFRPRLFLRLFGATRRAKNPKLRAVLLPRPGEANIARAATILPRSLILDQGNLAKVCTRVQFGAGACPRSSIYGYARAFSPLLDEPLRGPVYLRSSDNTLPDLVSDLRGQVDVELVSRTDSVRGRIRNIFDVVPDVPVSKFILTLRGGRRGLLVNSRNQCPRKRARRGREAGASLVRRTGKSRKRRRASRAIVRFRAQNGKKRNLRPRLHAPCGQKRHRHRRAGS
ncbi:MAG TPA: hypothetical protein VH703_01420 [Solirubrobacterales bacterium]